MGGRRCGLGFVVAFAVGATLCSPHPAFAGEIKHSYAVSLAGIPIGSAVLKASLTVQQYDARIHADIGWLGIRSRVEAEVSGKRAGQGFLPESFRMSLLGPKPRVITMQFAGQSVAGYQIAPPVTPEEIRDRVPVTADQLQRALDPLSALMSAAFMADFRAGRLCQNKMGVFIGLARFDLSLMPKNQEITPAGLASVICRVSYKPRGGHKLGDVSSGLAANPGIEVTFQWSQQDSIWAISNVTLPTSVGRLVIQRQPD